MGRRRWKKASGYHRRRVENAFFRYKSIFGGALLARSAEGQVAEALVACNVWVARQRRGHRPKGGYDVSHDRSEQGVEVTERRGRLRGPRRPSFTRSSASSRKLERPAAPRTRRKNSRRTRGRSCASS